MKESEEALSHVEFLPRDAL